MAKNIYVFEDDRFRRSCEMCKWEFGSVEIPRKDYFSIIKLKLVVHMGPNCISKAAVWAFETEIKNELHLIWTKNVTSATK